MVATREEEAMLLAIVESVRKIVATSYVLQKIFTISRYVEYGAIESSLYLVLDRGVQQSTNAFAGSHSPLENIIYIIDSHKTDAKVACH